MATKNTRKLVIRYERTQNIKEAAPCRYETVEVSEEEIAVFVETDYQRRRAASANPSSVERRDAQEILTEEITNLPEREKQAVSLLYYEEMHQKEIAEILGVTEPRISQILAQAHNRLNSRILERLRIPVSPLKGGPNG